VIDKEPFDETWIHNNPEVWEQIKKGLADAKAHRFKEVDLKNRIINDKGCHGKKDHT
jgi:hypothetical protein